MKERGETGYDKKKDITAMDICFAVFQYDVGISCGKEDIAVWRIPTI